MLDPWVDLIGERRIVVGCGTCVCMCASSTSEGEAEDGGSEEEDDDTTDLEGAGLLPNVIPSSRSRALVLSTSFAI